MEGLASTHSWQIKEHDKGLQDYTLHAKDIVVQNQMESLLHQRSCQNAASDHSHHKENTEFLEHF